MNWIFIKPFYFLERLETVITLTHCKILSWSVSFDRSWNRMVSTLICVCMWGYLKADVALRSWRRHNARESSANTSNITISQTQTCYCRWKIIQWMTSPNKTKVLTFLPQWPIQTVSPFIRPTLSPKYSSPQNRVSLSQFAAKNFCRHYKMALTLNNS